MALVGWATPLTSSGQQPVTDIYSFENPSVPAEFSADQGVTLSVSSGQKVHGKQSLKITWDGSGGKVLVKRAIDARNKTIDQRLCAAIFNLWLYQTDGKKQDALRFSFGRDGQEKPDCWFDYTLGFAGWRTMMMPYNRMAGKEQPAMDWIAIETPKGKAGEAYIDLLYPDVQFDRRHAMNDTSLTFYRDDDKSRVRPGKPQHLYHAGILDLPNPAIDQAKQDAVKALEQKFETELLKSARKPNIKSLRAAYQQYQLPAQADLDKLTTDNIHGRHIFFLHTVDIYKPSSLAGEMEAEVNYDLRHTSTFLLQLAKAWHLSTGDERRELETMIVSMNLLLLKSGWHEGHGQGTLHHYGYSSRSYYAASFLTRKLLAKHKLKRQVARAGQWFNHSHYCYDPYASTHCANMDYFNTMAKEQLLSLLMTDAIGERYHSVLQWSKTYSAAVALNRHGNNGGFKEDGSAFHHWGHYPAYESGALAAIGPMFKLLADTPFRLSPDAYRSFRRALLAIRIQCNKFSLPRTLSGRHAYQFKDNLSRLHTAYIDFAKSGTPEGDKEVDEEIAAIALRLFPDARDQFDASIQPEPDPNGHWCFPYANVGAHRRGDWLAIARGLSRYVWGSEIYGPVNRYGRYQSHGTLEILPPGGLPASGVSPYGWDWSRPPGATVTHLPLDLIPYESIIMMPTTDETFVGNCHMDQQDGLFAMVLKEKNEPSRPDIGLHALKSYHFFDDTIVCLGSAISNPNSRYPVETVLFQQHLEKNDLPVSINGKVVSEFPFGEKHAAATTLRDVVGNHYLVPEGQKLNIARQHQHSYYHYASIDGKGPKEKDHSGHNEATEADYAVAWLDHGAYAKDSSYHYAVLVLPTEQRAAAWQKSPGYTVLRHDSDAHIVQSGTTTSYALFQSGDVKNQLVSHVSEPCLVMTKQEGDQLKLNLTDPDLRMPGNEGGMLAGEIVIKPRYGPEVSSVTLTLNGNYELTQGEGVTAAQNDGKTTLTFTTLRGRTIPCVLKKSTP